MSYRYLQSTKEKRNIEWYGGNEMLSAVVCVCNHPVTMMRVSRPEITNHKSQITNHKSRNHTFVSSEYIVDSDYGIENGSDNSIITFGRFAFCIQHPKLPQNNRTHMEKDSQYCVWCVCWCWWCLCFVLYCLLFVFVVSLFVKFKNKKYAYLRRNTVLPKVSIFCPTFCLSFVRRHATTSAGAGGRRRRKVESGAAASSRSHKDVALLLSYDVYRTVQYYCSHQRRLCSHYEQKSSKVKV